MKQGQPIDVTVPGDKSLSHRALMFAALAIGKSRIIGILKSADVRSTAECLRKFGVQMMGTPHGTFVEGHGVGGLLDPGLDLDCGNSGTTARLLAGIVAGAKRRARFVGDESLSKRPMWRVAVPLTEMGAEFVFEKGDGLPMRVQGAALQPLDYTSPSASAQVKSALLLAGLTSQTTVIVREPTRSRDHTERMLAALGAPISVDGTTVGIAAGSRPLDAFEFAVPGDPSSAAFFAAWALLSGTPVRMPNVSINPTRMGFFTALSGVGAEVTTESAGTQCGEPVGHITVAGSVETPFVLGADDVPSMIDELPLIACLASQVSGQSVVTGAQELRVKESDRIAAVVANLRAIGADADELPDGFVVRGARKPLKGTITTHGDHRIAMAFGVLGALPGNDIVIDDPACAGVSFPNFWNELARLSSR